MVWYLLKLILLLPLIGAMAWGCLWLARRLQERAGSPAAGRSLRVVETLMLSPTLRLAVIEFHGREILVSASRQGLTTLAEAPARPAPAPEVATGVAVRVAAGCAAEVAP